MKRISTLIISLFIFLFTTHNANALTLSPSTLTLSAVYGAGVANQSLVVYGDYYSQKIAYKVTSKSGWITVSPSENYANSPCTLTLSFPTASTLMPGTYTGYVTIQAPNTTPYEATMTVNLTITPGTEQPVIAIVPNSGFSHTIKKGECPGADTFTIWNKNYGPSDSMAYTVLALDSWISASPASGNVTITPQTITLTYNTASLSVGTHTAIITIYGTNATNTPRIFNVSVTVMDGTKQPEIAIVPNTGFTKTVAQGYSPAADSFSLWNKNYGESAAMPYTVSTNASWLTCSPTSGSATSTKITVAVNYSTASLTPGTYKAQITITGTNAKNTPRILPVTLTVTGTTTKPEIAIVPNTGFTKTTTYGTSPPKDTFTLWNKTYGSSAAMAYTVSSTVTWATVSPASGTATNVKHTITVTYNTTNLAVGTYSGKLIIGGSDAINSPRYLSLKLTVNPGGGTPEIAIVPNTGFTVTAMRGTNAATQTFKLWNKTYGASSAMPYTVSTNCPWATCTPASGSATSAQTTINVVFNTSSLAVGTYRGMITIIGTNAKNTPRKMPINLTVRDTRPCVAITPTSLRLEVLQDQLPADGWCPTQYVTLWNSGINSFTYTATSNVSWMSITPSSGTCTTSNRITLAVNYSGLRTKSPGTYSGTITIAASAAYNAPRTIPVTLVLSQSSSGIWYTSQFESNVLTGWSPKVSSQWALSSGAYSATSTSYGTTMQSTYTGGSWLTESLSATMRRVYSDNYNQYQGIFFRATDDFKLDYLGSGSTGSAYVLLIRKNSWCLFFVNSGSFINIAGFTSSTAINTGSNAVNVVKVRAVDNAFTIDINNWTVWSGNDSRYRRPGKSGLIAVNPTLGVKPVFYFDNMTVSNPQ